MTNFIVTVIVLLIVGSAVGYIMKAKKRGVKCIGCPAGASCGGSCASGGCGGNGSTSYSCHSKED